MKKHALIKILLLCTSIAILLSLFSFLFMNRFIAIEGSRFRDEFLLMYARSISEKTRSLELSEIKEQKGLFDINPNFHIPPPPPPPLGRMLPPPPHKHDSRRGPPRPKHSDSWIVSKDGEVLAYDNNPTLPLNWSTLDLPHNNKEISSTENFFRLGPSTLVLFLENEKPLYLVVHESKRPFQGSLLLTQAIMTLALIIIALVLAMLATFYYLRRKSLEARSVLKRLEAGDLKARFEIHRLDEFGELMLDFNRMASEIEKLVERIHATERTRKQLLQEMGHDLRTPLTSLKTSFETLQIHYNKISEKDRQELFSNLLREIDYFKDLIEQLMTIASLDEPNFKKSTEKINIQSLIVDETKNLQRDNEKSFSNIAASNTGMDQPNVLGDRHLIQRLLRNGLENAHRYAKHEIQINLRQSEKNLIIEISDDGPGITPEMIPEFGQRREFRSRKITKDGHFSLGLGSVIMKTIAELHGGSIAINNIKDPHNSQVIKGAVLRITLPVFSEEIN